MKKNLINVALLFLVFFYGFLSHKEKIFPYQFIKQTNNFLFYKSTSKVNHARFSNTANKILKECTNNSDVIVIIGQSNASNSVSSEIKKSEKDLNYFEDKCYLLSEPVLGSTGSRESIASSLSSKINNRTSNIFLTSGWNGSSIKEWSQPYSHLTLYVNNNLKKILKYNNLKYIIWIQGESDKNELDINYIEHFKIFKKNILKGISPNKFEKLKFIVTQTSRCGVDDKPEPNIYLQQKELGKVFDDVLVTNVTDSLGLDYRIDGCHFNSFGVDIITDEISQIINKDYSE
jgi:hypothetical protein